jgi:hypothetical protein
MHTFANMIHFISTAYTGGGLKSIIRYMGLQHPDRVTDMYLRGEPANYIAAATLAVNQIGA